MTRLQNLTINYLYALKERTRLLWIVRALNFEHISTRFQTSWFSLKNYKRPHTMHISIIHTHTQILSVQFDISILFVRQAVRILFSYTD